MTQHHHRLRRVGATILSPLQAERNPVHAPWSAAPALPRLGALI